MAIENVDPALLANARRCLSIQNDAPDGVISSGELTDKKIEALITSIEREIDKVVGERAEIIGPPGEIRALSIDDHKMLGYTGSTLRDANYRKAQLEQLLVIAQGSPDKAVALTAQGMRKLGLTPAQFAVVNEADVSILSGNNDGTTQKSEAREAMRSYRRQASYARKYDHDPIRAAQLDAKAKVLQSLLPKLPQGVPTAAK